MCFCLVHLSLYTDLESKLPSHCRTNILSTRSTVFICNTIRNHLYFDMICLPKSAPSEVTPLQMAQVCTFRTSLNSPTPRIGEGKLHMQYQHQLIKHAVPQQESKHLDETSSSVCNICCLSQHYRVDPFMPTTTRKLQLLYCTMPTCNHHDANLRYQLRYVT